MYSSIEIIHGKAFQYPLLLYTMHCFFAFTSRMWELSIVLFVAMLTNNSLLVIALAGFVSTGCSFLFSSTIGRWFDSHDRLYAMKFTLIIKAVAITLAYLLCFVLFELNNSPEQSDLKVHLIYVIPIGYTVANLAFSGVITSIEKDWVVVLSSNDSNWLSKVNSVMTQIDLGCSALGPAIAGILFAFLSNHTIALLLIGINFISVCCLYLFLKHLYNIWPGLSLRQSQSADDEMMLSPNPQQPSNPDSAHMISTVVTSISYFLSSGCAGTMMAYSCLYLTALSYGSVMITYLLADGMTFEWLGITRGLAALSGFFGAWLFPTLIQHFGLVKTGLFSIWFQFAWVFIAMIGVTFASSKGSLVILSFSVLISRMGLWSFDLVARQIAQETIVEEHRNEINGVWNSIVAFFDMTSYLMCMLFAHPSHFYVLAIISSLMVFVGAVFFTVSTWNEGAAQVIFNISDKANSHGYSYVDESKDENKEYEIILRPPPVDGSSNNDDYEFVTNDPLPSVGKTSNGKINI